MAGVGSVGESLIRTSLYVDFVRKLMLHTATLRLLVETIFVLVNRKTIIATESVLINCGRKTQRKRRERRGENDYE